MQNKITFLFKNSRREAVFVGRRRIFDLLSETDFGEAAPDFPCGGKKTCKKCRVKILEGHEFVSEPDETEKKYISALPPGESGQNIRYACMCEVFGNVAVELENPSAGKMEIMTEGQLSGSISPDKCKKCTADLAEPTLENPISREKNLATALKQDLESLPFRLVKRLSEIPGEKIEAIICGNKIADLTKPGECADIYGAAVDIGTTTAAVYLHSLTSGKCIGVAADENPQRAYGADVISRINYTIENPDGLKTLKRMILSLIFGLIKNLCGEHGINPDHIYSLVLTGNTVMQHIAAGLPPKTIAFTPFAAASLLGLSATLDELLDGSGLSGSETINQNAEIYFPPALASYVGGDIATGIIASETDLCDEPRLFLDIGTNGEIGLGNKEKLIFCATAAGPAFEGAHIKLGMAGIKGAINNIYLDGSNKIAFTTIGNAEPSGICGSGIIDAVALMLELGAVDETGRVLDCDEGLEMPEKYREYANNLCEIEGENAFMLDKSHNIYITQKDIREIQLAKASVSAGITTLLHYCKKEISDIGELVLAGGFGAHIDKKSACRIGLIPAELEGKITVAGNTAGTGAAAVLLDSAAAGRINRLAKISEYVELSGDAFFMDEYVEKMMF
ncbi:MAG: ASKHA domain-containing protein [Oscillospiraceae bacterium]|nr:ASKHA domain-containing protein [Oscillospiraceae bacterium]